MSSSIQMCSAKLLGAALFALVLISPGWLVAADGPSPAATADQPTVTPEGLVVSPAREVLPPGALAVRPEVKTTTAATLLEDGFESTFPGATWQLYHPASGPDVDWGKSGYRKSAGSYSIWCAKGGSASPGNGGDVPVNTQSWAIAGPFDLSAATSAELSFDLWLETEANYDNFKWLASTNGTNFSGLQTSTDTSGFQTVSQDLSDWGSAGNLLGQSQVWIAFIYQSDGSNTYEGAYVDRVTLTADSGGGGNCGTYVVTADNDNNAYTGTPDGDWGYCLYNNDPKHPIEFSVDVNESSITSAQLLLLCHDVDRYAEPNNPEIDRVYVNNTYLGDLTGANDEDSTSIFTVPAGTLSTGRNRVRIDVNQNPGAPPDEWCVELKQAQLIVNGGCSGQATCRSVSTNRSSYNPGETVAVTYEIDTTATSQQIRVESNLVNPDGVIVAGAERNYTTNGSANDPKTVNLTLPANATAGTYRAQVLVFDSVSGQLESSCEDTFTVGGGGSCSITCGATVPATAQVGQTVSLNGSASPSGDCGTVEYFWFPEQGYSTATVPGRNATWVYNTPGTYTWLFVATGDNGGRCERTGTITVTGGGGGCTMTCSATVPATAQVGQTVNLTGSANVSGNCGTVEYFWFPEQGYSTATIFDRNATWIYNTAGTYNWLFSAVATNGQCERTGSINVTGGGGGSNVVWVPVVSRANGANNSTWVSDIGIFNPGTVAVNVVIRIYVTTGPISRTVTVNPGGQLIITDVVGWFNPGLFTSAAISITSSQTIIITSRTYNQLATGAICFPRGTLGQSLGGLLTTAGLSAGQSGWIPNLLEYASFRSNIGFTNTGSAAASLTVRLYNGNGTLVGTYNVNLNPGQWKQSNQPFREVAGMTNMRGGSAKVTVNSGSGVVVYGSVVDNITNDPTTIPFYR